MQASGWSPVGEDRNKNQGDEPPALKQGTPRPGSAPIPNGGLMLNLSLHRLDGLEIRGKTCSKIRFGLHGILLSTWF
jgi:hypothetical protein